MSAQGTFRPREHTGRLVLLRRLELIAEWVTPGARAPQRPQPAITAEVVVLDEDGGELRFEEQVITSVVLMRRAMQANGSWVAGRLVMGERAWLMGRLSEVDAALVAAWIAAHSDDEDPQPPRRTRAQEVADSTRSVLGRRGGAR